MKRLFIPILAALVVISLQHTAFAYDYRNDTINDSDKASLSELNTGILADLMLLDPNSSVRAYSGGIDWDQAKKVYAFDLEDFLNALEDGTLEDGSAAATALWKVPIYNDETGYGYAITSAANSEDRGYVTVSAPTGVLNQAEYLFTDDPIPASVDIENASIYITSVPEHSIDFLTIIKNDRVTMIPFATRPDFFGLTNGSVYSDAEIRTALANYIASTSGSGAIAAGGGNTTGPSALNTVVAAAGIVMIALTVMIIKKKITV